MNELLTGSIAGLVATAPMTLFMERAFKALPRSQRYPLPPRQITEVMLEKTGIDEVVDEQDKDYMTIAAHFAYGAAVGSAFAFLIGRRNPSLLKGATYGVSVWAASYLGWLPAFGILRPATKHPPQRTVLMVGAHIVWGTALSAIINAMRTRK